MITCKVNGRSADLFSDMKIQITIENPLFSDSFINQGYSYSFSFPLTAKNKALSIKNKSSVDVYFKGVLVIKSYIDSFLQDSSVIVVNTITDAKSFKETCENLYLKELDLDQFTVCKSLDSPTQKITKWQNHLDNNLLEDQKTVSHVFPMLHGIYNELSEVEENQRNHIFDVLGGLINRNAFGSYLLNFGVPNGSYVGKNWATSVCPCPKANYILKKIIEKLGYKIVVNELDEIIEYQQLFIVSNYVLDKLETAGGFSYNVHGTGYDLKNHVPNCTVYSFFEMLNEKFDASFTIIGLELYIYCSKTHLKQKAENVTKYASETFKNETSDLQGVKLSYSIDQEDANLYKNLPYLESASGYIYPQPFKDVNYPTQNPNNTEIGITHLPLLTYLMAKEYGFPRTHAEYLLTDQPQLFTTIYGYWQLISFAAFGRSTLLRSDEYDMEVEELSVIRTGCFRGIKQGFQPGFDGDPHTYPNHPFVSNFKKRRHIDLGYGIPIDLNYLFGSSSIHLSGPDNLFDVYKLEKIKLIYGSQLKTKILFLPLFELMELMKFRMVKHVIQQKSESFLGYVKSLSFALSNEGLSGTEVIYLIADPI